MSGGDDARLADAIHDAIWPLLPHGKARWPVTLEPATAAAATAVAPLVDEARATALADAQAAIKALRDPKHGSWDRDSAWRDAGLEDAIDALARLGKADA